LRRRGAVGDPPGHRAHNRSGWVQVDRAQRRHRRRHPLAAFRRLRGHVLVAVGTCAWPGPWRSLRPGPAWARAVLPRRAHGMPQRGPGPGRLVRAAIMPQCQHAGHHLRHLLNRAGQGPSRASQPPERG